MTASAHFAGENGNLTAMTYPYTNLTSAISDGRSPLRQYLNTQFPDTRAVQAQYRAIAGPLLVDGGTADPATLGAAFDFVVRLVLSPDHASNVATAGFGNPDHVAAIESVARIGGDAARACRTAALPDVVARVGWALALATEVYRVGPIPGSPIVTLIRSGRFTARSLLDLAPVDAIVQLVDLHRVATERLYPAFAAAPQSVASGPTFAASRLCAADADIIVDGVLIDIKTRLGRQNPKTGGRSDTLSLTDIYQIVAYALFDRVDAYRISNVGVYSARYGILFERPLQILLTTLASGPVDIRAERAAVWSLLGGS